MFGVGLPELVVIAALALLVLGPDRLPELARRLGRVVHDLKRAGQGVRDEFQTAMTEPDSPQADPPDPPSGRPRPDAASAGGERP